MRSKVILSFLAIQLVSFVLWQGVQARNGWNPEVIKPASANTDVKYEAATTPKQPFAGVNFSMKMEDKEFYSLDGDKKLEIISVLNKLPKEHISTLKNVVLDYNPSAHRGLGGKGIVIIRAVNMDDEEFFGVMIHEIGHNVDLGYLSETNNKKISEFKDGKKPVYETDPSLGFYRISWQDDTTRKKTAGNEDFVSGYAMTDPFEDFAESYVYYILHNKEFKSKTQTSEMLLQKYNYMKNVVFQDLEYDTGSYVTDGLSRRPWDITVLSYDLENFLSI